MPDTILNLFQPGKGILAADESVSTATKRLESVGVTSTEETRRQYRNLFLTAPGVEKYISGVILFEDSMYQATNEEIPFAQFLTSKGIEPGIKLDESTREMPGFPGEKITKGLDDLPQDLDNYRGLGATFTKWRTVISISDSTPTHEAIEANAIILAQYARMAQNAGLVPIVEPEVLRDGNHSIEKAQDVTTNSLSRIFQILAEYHVDLSNMILKTSMVVPGSDSNQEVSHEEVAKKTIEMLMASVPDTVPGIVFLSGGQTSDDAIRNLNEIAKFEPFPWALTFSYARALQGPALEVWRGKDENVNKAQKVFIETLKKVSFAEKGEL
ncbi:fructose-bisphosphate aldolase class I [bacterium]|uniref:fructose-bisphosphate aldolase n=1 Tax=candidate division WWE3 bacterium CG_4_9_14_3_um_filter_39_7 TaxID=1975080 RepID=A0A2M7X014_UNCKA|nr:fructose-bisphosphate aldolase class I [bacterium]PJA39301.1 MAG: fructose-bisphosphate aldolase class I [candidate division WWE3 bacterium CG_4_9_14_3_um_filter_39_7]